LFVTHRLLLALVATSILALLAATACAQPPQGGPMQGGPGGGGPGGPGGPMNGGPGGPGNGWGNQSGNWNNDWNNWNKRDRRGRRNRFFPQQQFSANAFSFTRPYPYHLDYYRMRWGGSYAPYYGNLYGPSYSFYPSQYNGDYGPNYYGQNSNPPNIGDPNYNQPNQPNDNQPNDPNNQPSGGSPPTAGDAVNGEWRWTWVPYAGSPSYGAGPPNFESVGPTYERGPVFHGPFETFVPVPEDPAPSSAAPSNAAPINALPNNSSAQPGATASSQSNNSQRAGDNNSAPMLAPAH
jgi:hypothetical protein